MEEVTKSVACIGGSRHLGQDGETGSDIGNLHSITFRLGTYLMLAEGSNS